MIVLYVSVYIGMLRGIINKDGDRNYGVIVDALNPLRSLLPPPPGSELFSLICAQ